MIGKLMLASYGSYAGDGAIGTMLNYWEQYGFFSYLLPFLLIFSIIFGILQRTKIFDDNKSISGIIAFVVGLMALQFDIVPQFFSEVFPRLGVGLAIILIILIVVGLFADPDSKGITYTLMGISAIVVVVILVQTAGVVGWSSAGWWSNNWPMIAGVVVILLALAIIVGSGSISTSPDKSPLARALRGES
ncbi:hypothetical protein GOV13_00765 [Candidatus Pacearchaeota archaeon]|nr:hypothetical protein [Candidatus Pacearchaeota archaeon]